MPRRTLARDAHEVENRLTEISILFEALGLSGFRAAGAANTPCSRLFSQQFMFQSCGMISLYSQVQSTSIVILTAEVAALCSTQENGVYQRRAPTPAAVQPIRH